MFWYLLKRQLYLKFNVSPQSYTRPPLSLAVPALSVVVVLLSAVVVAVVAPTVVVAAVARQRLHVVVAVVVVAQTI